MVPKATREKAEREQIEKKHVLDFGDAVRSRDPFDGCVSQGFCFVDGISKRIQEREHMLGNVLPSASLCLGSLAHY